MNTQVDYNQAVARPYEDLVSAGIQAREERDACSWTLGDCALDAVCRFGVNVKQYAMDVNEDRSRLQGLKDNAMFFPPAERIEYPANLAWWQFSDARRRSGWSPRSGEPPTEKQKAFARSILFKQADEVKTTKITPELADLIAAEKTHIERLMMHPTAQADDQLVIYLATALGHLDNATNRLKRVKK